MDTIKNEYDEVSTKKESIAEQIDSLTAITEQISALASTKEIKQYLKLCEKKKHLGSSASKLYKQMKIEEYNACNHIWVKTLIDYDHHEGRRYSYCGCIKCGLDQRVMYLIDSDYDFEWFTYDQQIMYEFMEQHFYQKGIYTKVLCDLSLAKAIYSRIKEVYPNIDDETARKYFEIALDNIRNIRVNKERMESRAQRLALSPKFDKWYARDIKKR